MAFSSNLTTNYKTSFLHFRLCTNKPVIQDKDSIYEKALFQLILLLLDIDINDPVEKTTAFVLNDRKNKKPLLEIIRLFLNSKEEDSIKLEAFFVIKLTNLSKVFAENKVNEITRDSLDQLKKLELNFQKKQCGRELLKRFFPSFEELFQNIFKIKEDIANLQIQINKTLNDLQSAKQLFIANKIFNPAFFVNEISLHTPAKLYPSQRQLSFERQQEIKKLSDWSHKLKI